ncbi:hypothetical protein [Bradyrhizobium amphicarpaeae]|nr:hypothetical protein [Bradyrhizobium amphicarpaeae]
MSLTEVPVQFDDKDELKTQIEFFIGQPSARKIEITKAGAGYDVVFTTDDTPPAPATGVA